MKLNILLINTTSIYMYGLYNIGFMDILMYNCSQLPPNSSLQSGCFLTYFLENVYRNF